MGLLESILHKINLTGPLEFVSTIELILAAIDPAIKTLFCQLLLEHSKVNFMGIVELFLGVHFS
jgi:hypothetical protein